MKERILRLREPATDSQRTMADIENHIRNFLHQIASELKYRDYELQVTPSSSGGGNFSSNLFRAKITRSAAEDLHIFLKAAALSETMRETLSNNIYYLEKYVYTNVKKAFRSMEAAHGVAEQHKLRFPEYYGASLTPMHELLALEDLAASGYGSHDRLRSIDWPYAASAVTELAKYHALSLAYQKEYPEDFKYFSENLSVDVFTKESFDQLMNPGMASALSVVREENRDKLKKFFDKLEFAVFQKHKEPVRCKFIVHGDFRTDNLLHRVLDDGSVEVMTVDHQTPRVGCPIYDLLFLIFSGTDKEFRDQYYNQLIEHYYTQLSEAMRRLGLNPEEIYSKEDYDFELKVNLPYGLMIAVLGLPIITVETENAPEIGFEMTDLQVTTLGVKYADRMNGVIDDFVRWGVLTDTDAK